MGVKLYGVDPSPPCRAAMMACGIFNVPFEKVEVNIATKDNWSPEFLKKNPLHTVPVLEDGDLILHDSHAILTYLADAYGKDESWYPKDVKTRALVNQKLFFNISILFFRLFNVLHPINKNLDQKPYEDIREAYGFIEEFLSRTTYLAADHVTIADLAVLSNMTSFEIVLPIDEKKFPKTSAWLTNLKNTPYCKKYNESGVNDLANLVKNGME